jgi:CRISPR-associated protein Csx14
MEHQLLVLFGLHPQVLTETLYGLCVRRKVPISRVVAIATAEAKQKSISVLLNPMSGAFYELCREYPQAFEKIDFSEVSIRVAQEAGVPIEDIRTSTQSQAYLDLIMATVSDMTSRDDVCLHCSVAGGRRTTSVYLAMVMQLLARPHDRMYHLLVSPSKAENHPGFFFPTRHSKPMLTDMAEAFDAKDVSVELVDIPYLRLRPRVPNELLASPSYRDILKWVQRDVEIAAHVMPLHIDPDKRCIVIGALEIALDPVELAVYWYFAEKSSLRSETIPREEYSNYFERPHADGHFSAKASSRMRAMYEVIVPKKEMRQRFLGAFSKEGRIELDHLRPHFTRINQKIRARLPDEDLHRWYLITSVGPRGDTCYGIRLDREFIRLPGPPRDTAP